MLCYFEDILEMLNAEVPTKFLHQTSQSASACSHYKGSNQALTKI